MALVKMYYLLFLAVLAAGTVYEDYPGRVNDCPPPQSGRKHCACGTMEWDPVAPECEIDYSAYPYIPVPVWCWYPEHGCGACAPGGGYYPIGNPNVEGESWCAPCPPMCAGCMGFFPWNWTLAARFCDGMDMLDGGILAKPDGPVYCTSGYYVDNNEDIIESACKECADEHAASCSDRDTPTRCDQGYYLNAGACEPCTGTGGAPAVGDCACAGTYGSGTCNSCMADCALCSDGSSCTHCNHHYVFDLGTNACLEHPWFDLPSPYNPWPF